jgi:uncharacterized protein YbjT (DUF2867 family)
MATKQVIAIVGGTGQQGGGVVDALLARGEFAVRVLTRNAKGDAARALAVRGVEIMEADLFEPSTLRFAFDGAYGAFLVSNVWDQEIGTREFELAVGAVKAARAAEVEHLVWSTLPDCEKLTSGRLKVPHFTGKAHVDAIVAAAGFARYAFVQAPFYFQNLLGPLAPQPLPDGGRGWQVPISPTARVIHAGDINDLGRAVSAAFDARDDLANGTYLAVCGGMYSWRDLAGTLNALGHNVRVEQVAPEVYDSLYAGAHVARETFQYFEACTYFGPEGDAHVAAARALVRGGFTGFADWARLHMKPSST